MPAPKWKLRNRNYRYTIKDLELDGFTVSETSLNNSQSTLGHKHPEEEFYIFIGGLGTMMVGSDLLNPVGPGDVMYIPGNEFHQVFNIRKRKLTFICIFRKEVT